jgi:hypothetical protein
MATRDCKTAHFMVRKQKFKRGKASVLPLRERTSSDPKISHSALTHKFPSPPTNANLATKILKQAFERHFEIQTIADKVLVKGLQAGGFGSP